METFNDLGRGAVLGFSGLAVLFYELFDHGFD